jgi:hypothetical protein
MAFCKCLTVSGGGWDQRLYCYLLSCSRFVYRSSEVSALAHRAVPATIEYHVTLVTWLHLLWLGRAGTLKLVFCFQYPVNRIMVANVSHQISKSGRCTK